MPRKRLTFTVEEQTYRTVVERLDADESVDDWVRAAIDERLDPSRDAGGDRGEADSGEDGHDQADREEGDYDGDDHDKDDYREPLEFVDDCAI